MLGQFPEAPAELLVSMEADLFTFRGGVDSDLIDGSIGEASPFHRTFGYYAHGVGEETAVLPAGWRDRLVSIQNKNTGGSAGLCLEIGDLAVSKLVAGREKDVDFLKAVLVNGLTTPDVVKARLNLTPITSEMRDLCLTRMRSAMRRR